VGSKNADLQFSHVSALRLFLSFVSEKVNNRSIWKYAITVPVAVEVLQPIIGRSFDVDDLILNFAGILAGYFIAVAVEAIRKNISARPT
jgi:glycopeptide antibiotics resistance protein